MVTVQFRSLLISSAKSFPQAVSAIVIFTGCSILLGWLFDSRLQGVYPDLAAMNPITGGNFVLAGLSLWLSAKEQPVGDRKSLRRGLGRVCAATVALIGLLKLGEYLFDWNLGVGELWFWLKLEAAAVSRPDHMAPNIALCFALVGFALMLLDTETPSGHRPAQFFTLAASLVAWLALIGYVYGMSSLFGAASYIPMVMIVILCMGILRADSNRGLMKIFGSNQLGSVMARRMFPAAIFIPILSGWLRSWGERAGLYGAAFGTALFAGSNIVVFAVLLYRTAVSLNRSDVERERAEDTRRASEERFGLLVEGVKDYAIFMLDPLGHITSWNRGAERIKGYRSDEIIGQHFSCFYPREDIERGKPEQELSVAASEGRLEDEGWRVRKDGSRFWADVVITAVRDEAGSLGGFSKVTRDITGRKQAEDTLRESEERIRSVIDTVHEAFIAMDTEGRITDWNHQAESTFGWPRSEAIGRPLAQTIIPAQYREAHMRGLQHFLATGQGPVLNKRIEITALHRDGHEFPVELTIAPLRLGLTYTFNSFVHDITARKQAEEALGRQKAELARSNAELAAANKELEAFTYSVSHDLRAPLRQISGFSQILAREFGLRIDPAALHCLQHIQKGVQQMGKLVDDLLNLGRVGRQALKEQLTDLYSLIEAVLTDLKPEAEGRKIEWIIGKLPSAKCDPGLIKLVFANLLSNAIKFTRHQERAIIQVDQMILDGEVVFFVRDNGVGFNMRYVDKLFGIFQRLHLQEDFEGTGVGLANVQRIIHKHGGRVWAEAEPYKGATFYFTLGAASQSERENTPAQRGAVC